MSPDVPRRWMVAAAVLSLMVLAVGVRWNTRAAGGADSYGYVSQAHAWLAGGPPIAEPLARRLRVHGAAQIASPLGYRPGQHAGELVPIYPPGLPWLMAGAIAAFGAGGAFLVAPVAGAVAVWCTFLLGRRAASSSLGFCAAALLATNPTFLYQVVQPMSDVPVTALWTACLVLACGASAAGWMLAGIAAGVAILVRPNLAPLAAAAALVGACAAFDDGRATRHRVAILLGAVGLPAAVAMSVILRLNRAWYGSAAASGYGTADELFSPAYIPTNALTYGRSLLETNPVVLPTALLVGVALVALRRARRPRALAASLVMWTAVVLALYLAYLPFPEWWYTRFLLPAYPAWMVLALMVLARASSAWRLPSIVAGTLVTVALCAGVWIAGDRGTFDLRRLEAKYEDAGWRVQRMLAPDAIVFAMMHSGSIRLYGHRPTLRWDVLRARDFDALIARMTRQGRRCYAVLDPMEQQAFLTRFAGTRTVSEGRLGRLFLTPHGVEVLALSPEARTR